jgi:hypothetical protein
LRTIFVSLELYILAFLLRTFLDSSTGKTLSIENSLVVVKETLPWFGAILAAVYAALYTRFSSQWVYVAGVYNQIKATEAQVAGSGRQPAAAEVIASWKAAFIEDADELHLALKGEFAALIKTWSEDEAVHREFVKYAPGGDPRLTALLRDVSRVVEERARDYGY